MQINIIETSKTITIKLKFKTLNATEDNFSEWTKLLINRIKKENFFYPLYAFDDCLVYFKIGWIPKIKKYEITSETIYKFIKDIYKK